jgi:hypothetical protein
VTRRARFARWASNPRTGLALGVSLLASAVIAFVVTSGLNEREALSVAKRATATATAALVTRDDSASRATRRIDKLTAQNDDTRRKLDITNELLGEALAAIDALRAQVEQNGGQPVANRPTTTTTRPAPPQPTTTTTRPRPTTTTTTTTRPCVVAIAGGCIGGSP